MPEKTMKDYAKESYKKRYFQLSEAEFDALFDSQNGACPICNSTSMVLEVHHVNGVVKGLVCQQCMVGLDMFKYDLTILQKAVEYLE